MKFITLEVVNSSEENWSLYQELNCQSLKGIKEELLRIGRPVRGIELEHADYVDSSGNDTSINLIFVSADNTVFIYNNEGNLESMDSELIDEDLNLLDLLNLRDGLSRIEN